MKRHRPKEQQIGLEKLAIGCDLVMKNQFDQQIILVFSINANRIAIYHMKFKHASVLYLSAHGAAGER